MNNRINIYIYIPGIIYPINKPYLIPYNGQQKWDRPGGHPVMGIRVVAGKSSHAMDPRLDWRTRKSEKIYIFIYILIYLCITLIYIYIYYILYIIYYILYMTMIYINCFTLHTIYDYDIYYLSYITYYILYMTLIYL